MQGFSNIRNRKNTIHPFSRIISPFYPILYSSKTRRKEKLSASTSDTLIDVKRTLAKPYPCRYNFQYREREREKERERDLYEIQFSSVAFRISIFSFFLLLLFSSSHSIRDLLDFSPFSFFFFSPFNNIYFYYTDVFL